MATGVSCKSEMPEAPLTLASSGLVLVLENPFYIFNVEGLQDKYLLDTI